MNSQTVYKNDENSAINPLIQVQDSEQEENKVKVEKSPRRNVVLQDKTCEASNSGEMSAATTDEIFTIKVNQVAQSTEEIKESNEENKGKEKEPECDINTVKGEAEKRQKKLMKQIKAYEMSIHLCEIENKIKKNLGMDIDACLEAMEELKNLPLTISFWKNNIQSVARLLITIKKCSGYRFNSLIREVAGSIYKKMKTFFIEVENKKVLKTVGKEGTVQSSPLLDINIQNFSLGNTISCVQGTIAQTPGFIDAQKPGFIDAQTPCTMIKVNPVVQSTVHLENQSSHTSAPDNLQKTPVSLGK